MGTFYGIGKQAIYPIEETVKLKRATILYKSDTDEASLTEILKLLAWVLRKYISELERLLHEKRRNNNSQQNSKRIG